VIGVAGYLGRMGVTDGGRDSSMGFAVTIRYTNLCNSVLVGEDDNQRRRE
jgi:hypothetical protein